MGSLLVFFYYAICMCLYAVSFCSNEFIWLHESGDEVWFWGIWMRFLFVDSLHLLVATWVRVCFDIQHAGFSLPITWVLPYSCTGGRNETHGLKFNSSLEWKPQKALLETIDHGEAPSQVCIRKINILLWLLLDSLIQKQVAAWGSQANRSQIAKNAEQVLCISLYY